jgi:hypothetical protein
VLLVGDSLATSIVGGARFVAPDLGVDVVNGAVNGCQLDADVTALEMQYDGRPGLVPLNPTCLPTWRSTRLTSDPDVVVLVYGTASAFERFQLGGHWVDSCDQAYAEWYRPLLRSALRALAARGVPVELATLPYPVGAWLPSDARARIDCMNQLNRSAASTVPGVRLLDLGGYICPRGACLQTVDGEPLRADGVHFGHSDDAAWTSFSGAGAVLAARWVLTQALAAPNAASIHSRRTA